MSASAVTPASLKKGVVKQVLSGDSVVIRAYPKNGPPPEKTIAFSYVTAPKLARRPVGSEETKDEPWAWEAREYLRKRLVGKEVYFSCERPPNSTRDYGFIFMGRDPEKDENIVESIISEGLVTVRRDAARGNDEIIKRLIALEDSAKSAGRGKWGNSSPAEHVRNIHWTQDNPRYLVDQYEGKPVKAIIEHVRDGSTIRAFLLPDYHYITLMISGIRCPGVKLDAEGKPDPTVKVPFADEARFFVESALLQRDVEIRLESVNNSNLVGSILYPKGNIAEALLRQGFAKCVDWSMAFMKTGADKLRKAEREAKENKLRLWKDYQSNTQVFSTKEKDFQGTVVEVFNGDAINVKMPNGQTKKVFLSSIRPPRDPNQRAAGDDDAEKPQRNKITRPLYDIPCMFEAREFLRKKLIGKKVHCILDYISPARDNFPEKYCYTVLIGDQNVAETMVSKGYATVVRYRQDDDQRSSRYDDLLTAETQAIKGQKGVHAKKENTPHRINDLTADHSRIKQQYLPAWQRAMRTEAIVEFVASGSRLRLYIPKDSCLVTFLLGGISCPRSSRPALNGVPAKEEEPFGDEALAFTKDRVLQRDVSVHIETTDKMGSCVIGWLWTDNNVNLSVALVEEGLAEVHFTAEKSEHYRALKTAEDKAKAAKKGRWANYVEEAEEKIEEEKDEKVVERKIKYESIIVTEVGADFHFYAQHTEQGGKLETLMTKLRQEFQTNPPITGSYTAKRGDVCAAKFSADNEWYRAKIEKVQNGYASIYYFDYGNKENVPLTRLAALPPAFISDKPYANEYALALIDLPPDNDDKEEALKAFAQDVLNRQILLNIEYYKNASTPAVTLYDPTNNNSDIGKGLVSEGLLLAEKRKDRKLKELIDDYKEAQELAKTSRRGIWQYGDITQDDAAEFGR